MEDASAENEGKRVLDLTSAYEDQHGPIMRSRIKMVGVRLGAVLNGYLGQQSAHRSEWVCARLIAGLAAKTMRR